MSQEILRKPEPNQSSLAIAQQFPADHYNLLVPMQTVAEISEIHKPVMNVVSISTNLDDQEIYVQEKAKSAWGEKPATPAKYALTKKGLTKLMKAAGIKILSSRPVIPSTCQKCAAMNASIGKPVRCGACPNKDVKYEVRISVPQLTGENITIVANKEIIVDDVVVGMSDKQRAEFLKFRNEMCESKALNRALRTAMQIKSTYYIEEFRKPFVVAYLVPNLDNPAVQQEAIRGMFGTAHELYGTTPVANDARRTVYVDDDLNDDERGNCEAPEEPQSGRYIDITNEPARETADYQQMDFATQQQNSEPDPYICVKCGKTLTKGVSRFSISSFGVPLCMECQAKYADEQ